MKKTIILKSLITSSQLFTYASAEDKNFIELGFGSQKSSSHFEIPDDESIKKDSSKTSPLVRFKYAHELNEKTNTYIKSQQGDLNLGIEYKLSNAKIDFGITHGFGTDEVWADPFNKNTNTKKTDVSKKGMYLAYSKNINKNLHSTFKYELTSLEYDADQVHNDLKRDGSKHLFSLENIYKGYILNLHTEIYNAEGKASSYKALDFEAGKAYKLNEKISMFTMLNVGTIQYDEINPELTKKIDGTSYGAKMRLTYNEPFNYKNSYAAFTSGYEQTNANDSFYDENNTYGFISFGYKF